jgi:SAM-dependent methyltransferase
VLGRLFYLGRLDREDRPLVPTGPRAAANRLNQALVERGATPPWVWSAERCQEYWSSRERDADVNEPSHYARKPLEIVDFMHAFWGDDVDSGGSVLELGPNAGPNLERLRRLGFQDLHGVEINPSAVQEMKAEFPDLAAVADIRTGPMEEVLPRLGTNSMDTVFSMGVLMHVHPTSHAVFGEMVRVARNHISIIETETANATYVFARNYRRVFERLGCVQVREEMIDADTRPAVDPSYYGLVARLLSVPG